jgi:hypothetical protein
MGGHTLIYGYSAEYPLFLAKSKNVFSPTNLATLFAQQHQ